LATQVAYRRALDRRLVVETPAAEEQHWEQLELAWFVE